MGVFQEGAGPIECVVHLFDKPHAAQCSLLQDDVAPLAIGIT
jgi:hypothetical protein